MSYYNEDSGFEPPPFEEIVGIVLIMLGIALLFALR